MNYLLLFFMYTGVLSACKFVWWYGISRTGVTQSSELPCGCWELNLGPREEQPVLLTSEPSLQLWKIYSSIYIKQKTTCSRFAPNLNVDDFLVLQVITQLYQTGKKTKMGEDFVKEKNGRDAIFHGIRDNGASIKRTK